MSEDQKTWLTQFVYDDYDLIAFPADLRIMLRAKKMIEKFIDEELES